MAKTKDLKNFQFGNHTDVGRVRKQNEDYLGYFDTINGDVFVVCDGMGGHAGGMKASRMAVDSIKAFMERRYVDQPEQAVRQAITYANEQVYAEAMNNPELRGMGTTCVLLLVRDGLVYHGHVGDSRIYLLSDKKLRRLTRDHSFVQKMVDQGLLTEEEAEKHPRRNELLAALGPYATIEVSVGEAPIRPGKDDTFLLCSDGLTGHVNDRTIESVLNENMSVQHKALKLVDMANDGGGQDNITVQLVNFFQFETPADPVPVRSKRNTMPLLMLGIVMLVALGSGIAFYYSREKAPSPNSLHDSLTVDSLHAADGVVVNTKPEILAVDTVYYDYRVNPKKDNMAGIARRFMVPISRLKGSNQLLSDDLKQTRVIRIPFRARHIIQKGQIIDSLVQQYEVNRDILVSVNNLKESKGKVKLQVGDTVYIPFIF